MSDEVWSVNGRYKIVAGDMTKEVSEPITTDLVKAVARESGFRHFVVQDSEGRNLTPADFPFSGDIKIVPYNKMAEDFTGEVWSTNGVYTITAGDLTKEVSDPITTDLVKAVAREAGFRHFVVQDEDGRNLTPADFPYRGNIKIVPYNKMA